MIDKERIRLYLAALLHDIGKPLQRANYNIADLSDWFRTSYSHAGIGAGFLEKEKGQFPALSDQIDVVQRIIRNHHEPTEPDERIVQLSDWLSSGERIVLEVDKYEEILRAKEARLLSIFTKIFEGTNRYYYELLPLDVEKLFPVTRGKIESDTYENLVKGFEEDIQRTSDFSSPTKLFGDLFLETIFHLCYKYFWAAPAQTPKAGYEPDVSLFDHVKITAALGICLYDDIQAGIITDNEIEEICRKLKNFSFNPPEDDPLLSKNLFFLLNGDLSGIQDFVFNIPSKGAAKSLKGRSLYLELLTEIIAKHILREFDLPISNLVYSGGGNFYLLVPIPQEAELKNIRKKILEILVKAHHGSLYFALTWIPLAVKDFYGGRIVNKWKELNEQSGKLKRKRFSELGLEKNLSKLFGPFEFEPNGHKNLCQVCHQEKKLLEEVEEGEKICAFCDSFKELAESLKNAVYYCESLVGPKELSVFSHYREVFESLGFKVNFSQEPLPGALNLNYVLNEISKWEITPNVVGFRFLPRGIPVKEGRIKSFDEIGQESEGLKALGLLKMDVDNLGCIFREGLPEEQRTLSRIATLSRLFHLFFSGRLNYLWEHNFQETAYVIFAGGDDSLIFGAWDKLYDFMKLIREAFEKFVAKNSDVTLSGSFSMFPVKFPVVKNVSVAEERLSEAKARSKPKSGLPHSYREKNVISVLGVPLKYNSEFPWMDELRGELLGVKDEKGEEYALRLARKVTRATRGFKGILEDSLRGTLKPDRIWRFAYFLRKERDLKLVEKLIKMNEKIILENLAGKGIVETHLILPLAARLVDFKLRKKT